MLASQRWFSRRTILQPKSIIPLVAGCLMLCAGILPWLSDPLGERYSAWKLPLDIGWQFRTAIFNYGLLCLCCAIYAFLVACANWKPFKGSDYFVGRYKTAGLLCLIPVVLFFLQYIFIDFQAIDHLAQHEIQALLIRAHYGYRISPQHIPLNAFTLNISTLQDRLEILIDQISIGVLLPFSSAWLLIDYRRFFKTLDSVASKKRQSRSRLVRILLFILLLAIGVVLGRAPAALVCEYQAEASLASGNYTSALGWLDAASFLNPAFNQVASYHIERGQALYYLYPKHQSDDSRAYLTFTYREQGDYLDAYQQLLAVSQSYPTSAWVIDEMSLTLERQAESIKPLYGQPMGGSDNDEAALQWLQLLAQIDPNNVYGQYIIGRIQYNIHNYTACTAQMSIVVRLSSNPDIQSSAYTYMALSDAGQGDYIDERVLLFKAVQLDPNYHNNTAREELSGLH